MSSHRYEVRGMKLFVDTSISAELSKISVRIGGARAPFKSDACSSLNRDVTSPLKRPKYATDGMTRQRIQTILSQHEQGQWSGEGSI